MDQKLSNIKIHWKRIIYLIIVALFGLFIINQVSSLRSSFKYLHLSDYRQYGLILLIVLGSFLMAALSYFVLSFRRLKLGRTLLVQFASNTLNKLLPAGIGAIGANYLYLRRTGSKPMQAAATVGVNNIMGIIASIFLLVFLLFIHHGLGLKFARLDFDGIVIVSFSLIILISFLFLLKKIRTRIIKLVRGFIQQLVFYRDQPLRVLAGFGFQLMLALFNILALYLSLRTVSASLNILAVMIIYSAAIWFGSLIPAPGGLGSVEAGLVGAFLAYGLGLPETIATVLIFRLLNFWAPLIVGVPALIIARSKQYL